MKVEPQQSDWSEMVKMDFNKNEITLDEEKIKTQSVREYKNEIKRKVREATLRDLLKLQQEHKKARQIIYTDLKKPQEYLISPEISNEEATLLFNLRCRSVRTFKENFKALHSNKTQCGLCQKEKDTQEHALECPVIQNHVKVEDDIVYEDLVANVTRQKRIAALYRRIVEVRERLLGEETMHTGAT